LEARSGRVHINFPKEPIFLATHQPAEARVLVKLRAGAQLSAQNVAAICRLTSSAVQGLGPESEILFRRHVRDRTRDIELLDRLKQKAWSKMDPG
jgi:type III secretory pathway lipoprotein EscJ